MKKVAILACLVLAISMLASCAPGPNDLVTMKPSTGNVAGFWMGLWNGVIAPVTFIISLFTKSVQMYEVHNNGGWYNLGFLFGMMVILGGGGGSAAARRSRR